MKAPNLPTLRLRRPSPQLGHWRGSPPSALGGKMCGPRISFSASSTSPTRRSLISPTAAVKSRQKSRSTSFHSSLPSEMRSSFSSRSAVKSYST